MAWKDTLQDASFRGVAISCRSTSDRLERAVAQYEYPHRDGADTDDLGARARQVRITAVLWGPQYERDLQELLFALGEPGPGELVHPVFGRINAQLLSADVRHSEDEPDRCELDLAFLESAEPVRFFARVMPAQQAGAARAKVAAARDKSIAKYGAKSLSLAAKLRGLRAKFDVFSKIGAITSQIKGMVNGVITAGLNLLSYPTSWATDIRSMVQSVTSLPRTLMSRIDGTLAGWRILRNTLFPRNRASGALQRPAVTPRPGVPLSERDDVPVPVRMQLLAQDLVLRETALELADVAAELLGLEADQATLTPTEIASVAADAREQLQAAIDSASEIYGIEDGHELSESLRDVAAALQAAAESVIVARPPLLLRQAPGDCNVHLLAHWWYGDATRAEELRRLNPDVARRVLVKKGDSLYGYAR